MKSIEERARQIIENWNMAWSSKIYRDLDNWQGESPAINKIYKGDYALNDLEKQIKQALFTMQNETREEDARIAEHLSVLADHEKSCCGDIPEMMLRSDIAQAIRSKIGG